MRISDWISDVCSSDLLLSALRPQALTTARTCGAKASSSSIRSIASILYDEKTLPGEGARWRRSEEHTSELQSLMRISYAVFCLKKKNYISLNTNLIKLLTSIRYYVNIYYNSYT